MYVPLHITCMYVVYIYHIHVHTCMYMSWYVHARVHGRYIYVIFIFHCVLVQ
jgi:hypothetical protein